MIDCIEDALQGRLEVLHVLHECDPLTEREKIIAMMFLALIDDDEHCPMPVGRWSKKAAAMYRLLQD